MKEQKTLLRSVMRLLHPDLFSAYPTEQEINATALKRLNHYLDELAQKLRPTPISLHFWIKKKDALREVRTQLESDGILAPLYHALGLITRQEYVEWMLDVPDYEMDADLLDWLKIFVHRVVQDGEHHSALRSDIAFAKTEIEALYQLKRIEMGSEFGMGVKDLRMQLELLHVLEGGLDALGAELTHLFAGLSLCVHQPDATPVNPFHQSRSAIPASHHASWIADDGCIHLAVKPDSIVHVLKRIDLDRAGLLSRLQSFWEWRAAELGDSLKELFRVKKILFDTTTSGNAQRFVLWAGCIMTERDEIQRELSGKDMPLTLLVHSDDGASMVDYSMPSSTLHVRTDCTVKFLLNFLRSDRCLDACDDAQMMLTDDSEERRILEEARKALGAKQVIRICSIYERQHVIRAAERLIENAESIRQSIDLSDAGIAIDSNYQAWESGFVSIPYDYQLAELRPNLKKLIGGGEKRSRGTTVSRRRERPMAHARLMARTARQPRIFPSRNPSRSRLLRLP